MAVLRKVDLLIAGGGLGGCAAAMAACEKGLTVAMTEETAWIGGQVTAQGVPPDEHPWIEEFGCTGRYRTYRDMVRKLYARTARVRNPGGRLNPGKGIVSNICHDPRASLHVLEEMLFPYVLTGQLAILTGTKLKKAEKNGGELVAVTLEDLETGAEKKVEAAYFIDATETGDLLPLAGMPYKTGAESKAETGEPHALETADPEDIQAFTFVLAMEYRPGENHVIERPAMYEFWKAFKPDFWPDQYLSFYAPHPITKEKRQYTLFREESGFPLWEYRRIFAASQFESAFSAGDVSLMNWPMNDYFIGNVYDVTPEEKEKHLYGAKQLSLSLFYWLQTEAPRPDGGRGWTGLKLRPDVFGTEDGLAKAPYIRESRRIFAEYTVTEQDVSPSFQPGKTGKRYFDTVGIGSYSIDLHPSMAGRNYLDIEALPFHIPLGALLPKEIDNVLAGNKNIGTTHITNGCYRLHPVEWNIGEACGALAAFCLENDVSPKDVRNDGGLLKAFQEALLDDGFELEWPADFYTEGGD